MSRPFSMPDVLLAYLDDHNTPPDAQQQDLIDIAAGLPAGGMKLSHDAAVLVSILVRAIRPRFAVEVGTFIGYSSLAIARALPADGRLLCCDVNAEWTAIAQRQWEAAGVADKVELKLGPATETLAALQADQPIDFAFVDADKGGYIDYYEQILSRLSPHGVMAIDNTMWSGRVADPNEDGENTVALRAFNRHVVDDSRTTNVIVPLGDGLTLVSKNR